MKTTNLTFDYEELIILAQALSIWHIQLDRDNSPRANEILTLLQKVQTARKEVD